MVTDRLAPGDTCEAHPGSTAVARCEECGRRVCIACAVPVRGRVVGTECLGRVLGDESIPEPPRAVRPPWPGPGTIWLGFLLAVTGTILPWTRFGQPASAFGAWASAGGWARAAVVAAVAGFVTSAVARLRRTRSGRPWLWILAAAALVGAAAVLLSLTRPPAFSRPWLGPWTTLSGFTVASIASLGALFRRRDGIGPRRSRS